MKQLQIEWKNEDYSRFLEFSTDSKYSFLSLWTKIMFSFPLLCLWYECREKKKEAHYPTFIVKVLSVVLILFPHIVIYEFDVVLLQSNRLEMLWINCWACFCHAKTSSIIARDFDGSHSVFVCFLSVFFFLNWFRGKKCLRAFMRG